MSKEVRVAVLPNCDICTRQGKATIAAYDGKTTWGPWAFMCEDHFKTVGLGLGEGLGQRLILIEEES